MLKPGLDLLATRLAAAQLGSFPFRHPWHRIDFVRSSVHRNQAFDQGMADRIIAIRRKLSDITSTRKVRLDVLEIAGVALALRISPKTLSPAIDFTNLTHLASKLEKYRKRAKRAAKVKHEANTVVAGMETWRGFVEWLRYNVLYAPSTQKALLEKNPAPFGETSGPNGVLHWRK